MKLKYICYKGSSKGFIQTRKPLLVNRDLAISFKNAPANSTAIFTNDNGATLYRDLKENACIIPIHFLVGEIKIVVAVLDGTSNAPKYSCESFFAERQNDTLFVYPNGMDVPAQIVSIYGEIQALKDALHKSEKKYEALEKRVESYEKNGVELLFEDEGV